LTQFLAHDLLIRLEASRAVTSNVVRNAAQETWKFSTLKLCDWTKESWVFLVCTKNYRGWLVSDSGCDKTAPWSSWTGARPNCKNSLVWYAALWQHGRVWSWEAFGGRA